MTFSLLCCCLQAVAAAATSAPSARSFNVKELGAVGDGRTHDTPAINRAIEAASQSGGGIVHFPPGQYLSTSIHLKSRVTLDLARGAVIVAAPRGTGLAYDAPEPNRFAGYQDFGHGHWHDSLIWGEDLHDVAITGEGSIRGDNLAVGHTREDDPADKAIALKRCRGVRITGISIVQGGHVAILATGVDDLTIERVLIDTDRDGIDIDCCHEVRLTECRVNAPNDDGICLKSSYALGEVRSTQDVTLTRCTLSGYPQGTIARQRDAGPSSAPSTTPVLHHRIVNGRLKFGTESNGGLKNLKVVDCHFEHCAGLAFETVDGGDIDGVTIDHVTMRDISNAPLFLRLGARLRGPGPRSALLQADANLSPADAAERAYRLASKAASARAASSASAASRPGDSVNAVAPKPSVSSPVPDRFQNAGHLQNVLITNMIVEGAPVTDGIVISGIPGHPIDQVKLQHIRIICRGGGRGRLANSRPPELETRYPEPDMFNPLPAYGLFARHVHGITCDDLFFKCARPDGRPAMAFEDVTDRVLNNIQADHP